MLISMLMPVSAGPDESLTCSRAIAVMAPDSHPQNTHPNTMPDFQLPAPFPPGPLDFVSRCSGAAGYNLFTTQPTVDSLSATAYLMAAHTRPLSWRLPISDRLPGAGSSANAYLVLTHTRLLTCMYVWFSLSPLQKISLILYVCTIV